MTVSILSPFRYLDDPRPSIFATDSAFCKAARTGRTMGQIQSAAIKRAMDRTGINPGSVRGLSPYADLLIEEANHRRSKSVYRRRDAK